MYNFEPTGSNGEQPDDRSNIPDKAPAAPQKPFLSAVFQEIIQVVLPALLLAVTVHLFLAQATVVFGQSMEPNLSAYQRLIIDKISYHFRSPHRNDIVVLKVPTMDELLVKRIVALPGETVRIENGIVYINNEPLPELFAHDQSPQNMETQTLGPLQYFVLGDNRGNSNDSRVFGPIDREYIVGRVWVRYWPLNQFKYF